MQEIIRNIVAALVHEWTVRQALKHLHSLEARALKDMGLNEGNLDYAVRHGRDALGGAQIQPRSSQRRTGHGVPALESR